MDKFLSLYCAFQGHMLTRRDERGQGTLEYVGMVVLAAGIIAAILALTPASTIAGKFGEALTQAFGGGGGGT